MNAAKMPFYIDTSALVKLITAEPETNALKSWLTQKERILIAGDLVQTELLRAAHKQSSEHIKLAKEVLGAIQLIRLGERVFKLAGLLDPPSLRSLDAIHLTTALEFGHELQGIVTYDSRMAHAAANHGVAIVSPGAKQTTSPN